MKTQKEIETINYTYETSRILLNLFSDYKEHNLTSLETYNLNTLTSNANIINKSTNFQETTPTIIKHRKSFFKRIIDKFKSFF